MILAECIRKNKDSNGRITSYTLRDLNGNRINVDGKQIKEAIKADKIKILNMELSDSGRLVDKTLTKSENALIEIYHAIEDFWEELKSGEGNRFDCDCVYCNEFIERVIEKYFGIK